MTAATPLPGRCDGITSARGKPLPCCIQCSRRLVPADAPLIKPSPQPVMLNRVWHCDLQVPFAE